MNENKNLESRSDPLNPRRLFSICILSLVAILFMNGVVFSSAPTIIYPGSTIILNQGSCSAKSTYVTFGTLSSSSSYTSIQQSPAPTVIAPSTPPSTSTTVPIINAPPPSSANKQEKSMITGNASEITIFISNLNQGNSALADILSSVPAFTFATGFTRITMTADQDISSANITFTLLSSLPGSVSSPSDTPLIILHATTGLSEQAVGPIDFVFTVNKAELSNDGVDVSTIALSHFDGGSWAQLQTNLTSSSGNSYSFEAVSPSLSYFAITGVEPLAISNVSSTQTQSNTTGLLPVKSQPWYTTPIVIASSVLILVVIVLSSLALVARKTKKPEEPEGETESKKMAEPPRMAEQPKPPQLPPLPPQLPEQSSGNVQESEDEEEPNPEIKEIDDYFTSNDKKD